MKKLLILSVIAAVGFGACKKKEGSVSTLHNYSKPTIILVTGEYYSIPVGGLLPEIVATAYDSFYNEPATVVFDQSKLDNTVPGVYPVIASAKNRYGMAASRTLYIAVSNVSADFNLAGKYARIGVADTVMVTRLANGFYQTSDVAANGASDTMYSDTAYFLQTSAVALTVPSQMTKFGTVYSTGGAILTTPADPILLIPGDTTYEYTLHNNALAPTIRQFKKLH